MPVDTTPRHRSPGAFATHPIRVTTGAALLALATLAFFVQIERGLGDITLSLVFVGHNIGLTVALMALLVLVCRRPWTATVAAVSIVALVWLGSFVKMKATGLPAVASDLPRLLDAWPIIRPFAWPVLAAATACLALLTALYRLETPFDARRLHRLAALAVFALGATGSWSAHSRIPEREVRFVTDQAPKIATFVRSLYARPAFEDLAIPALGPYCCFRDRAKATLDFTGAEPPNIVVVLQESTFPPDHLHGVGPVSNVLFDGSFPLVVDTTGGGTWVQEYSVLHGVAPPAYGADFVQILGLGPKRGLQGRLAPMLAAIGYRTVAMVPYSEGELLAGETYRTLGFQQIDDCGRIEACRPVAWSDVPDSAVYDHALKTLRASDGPMLVYIPTIRQHSPHGERYPKARYRNEILDEYRRRLDLSATEADSFLRDLRGLARPTIVLMFGDHIPADVYEAYGPSDFRKPRTHTFFNLFDPTGRATASTLMAAHPSVEAVSAGFLDAVLLKAAGFSSDYIDRKLAMMDACRGSFCVGAPAGPLDSSARTGPGGRVASTPDEHRPGLPDGPR